jgi:hypothetical protein
MEYPTGVMMENMKRKTGMCPWLASSKVCTSIRRTIIRDWVIPMTREPEVINMMTIKKTTS